MEKMIERVFEVKRNVSGKEYQAREWSRSGESHQVDLHNDKGYVETISMDKLRNNYTEGKQLI